MFSTSFFLPSTDFCRPATGLARRWRCWPISTDTSTRKKSPLRGRCAIPFYAIPRWGPSKEVPGLVFGERKTSKFFFSSDPSGQGGRGRITRSAFSRTSSHIPAWSPIFFAFSRPTSTYIFSIFIRNRPHFFLDSEESRGPHFAPFSAWFRIIAFPPRFPAYFHIFHVISAYLSYFESESTAFFSSSGNICGNNATAKFPRDWKSSINNFPRQFCGVIQMNVTVFFSGTGSFSMFFKSMIFWIFDFFPSRQHINRFTLQSDFFRVLFFLTKTLDCQMLFNIQHFVSIPNNGACFFPKFFSLGRFSSIFFWLSKMTP